MGTERIGILGGTGDLGAGLALRWAAAGVPVTIGSRDPERARRRAVEFTEQLPAGSAPLDGAGNLDAARVADVVVVAVPFESSARTVASVAEALDDRILVSTVVPLAFDQGGPHIAQVEGAPSVAELLAAQAPTARVVSGFHSVAAGALTDLATPLDDDVLLCGDDDAAIATVAQLVELIDGATPVVAGRLRLSPPIEGLTAALIAVNKRYKAHVGLRLSRLPR